MFALPFYANRGCRSRIPAGYGLAANNRPFGRHEGWCQPRRSWGKSNVSYRSFIDNYSTDCYGGARKGGENLVNPKQFLQVGGIILVVVAILGWLGVIGPTADRSIFGGTWYFDNAENWAHLVLGVVALVAAYMASASLQKNLTMVVGVIALLAFVWNLFSTSLDGAMLQRPLDTILHLAIGVWALWASMKKVA